MTADPIESAPGPARLTWPMADFLPPDAREELLGPGAPFELAVQPVLGTELTVFVRRPHSLRAFLDEAVERTPDLLWLVAGDRRWTFAEAAAEIDRIGRVLVDRYGVGKGDRVAMVSANSPEYGLAMWATLTIGAVVTSLNGWWTAAELQFGIELTEPVLVLGDERRLARLADASVPADVAVVPFDQLLAEARALDPSAAGPVDADVDEDDPAVILFTSGTTGRPKGATLSHRNILHFGRSMQLMAAFGAVLAPPGPSAPPRQMASILASPVFHVSGMIGILLSGPALSTKQVFAPPGRWDPKQHLDLTAEHGITTWSGVPTQFWRLLRHEDFADYDLTGLRSIGGGGAPFPPELIRLMHELVPNAVPGNGFGMSETVGLGTLAQGPILVMEPTSVGPAQAGSEVEIRGPAGELLAEGEVGEIYLRSPTVFLGYWNDDESTVAVLDRDRWYRTGDFGRAERGLLFLESRMRDLIIRGGENIYPMEIENRLVEHPDIDDAAVIGVDHEELGQEVKAFVVLRPGAELSTADVQRWVADALAPYKVPAQVERRTELPYTESGKLLKRELS
jgi:acyl-CoA synthetase (AMP-forming)/AMP-acid ligase II